MARALAYGAGCENHLKFTRLFMDYYIGYHHRARKATCGGCKKEVAWFWDDSKKASNLWACSCGVQNHIKPLPDWPPVPRSVYTGHDRLARFKVYPVPPEHPNVKWAQPFSIRSFISQVSKKFGGCHYACNERGKVMGETVFADVCLDDKNVNDNWAEPVECHLVSGWTTGQESCPLWQHVLTLCQTESEKRFLHRYLAYVKDRQFPMLIPQTWIGIADRRRPDFVAFVPLQYWKYRWIAIQLDGAHGEANADDDWVRDQYIQENNYEVLSLRPNEKGYLEEVRRLVEQFEKWMTVADTDPWQVAVEAEITKAERIIDIPF
jgi:hypothetical protein